MFAVCMLPFHICLHIIISLFYKLTMEYAPENLISNTFTLVLIWENRFSNCVRFCYEVNLSQMNTKNVNCEVL